MTTRLTLVLFVLAPLGCDGGDGRVSLDGSVTYGGKTVPSGRIMFDPDTERGLSDGVQGSAEIVDGRYTTLPDFGPQGGAYTARLEMHDGKATPILPKGERIAPEVQMPVRIDPAVSSQTIDFDIPLSK